MRRWCCSTPAPDTSTGRHGRKLYRLELQRQFNQPPRPEWVPVSLGFDSLPAASGEDSYGLSVYPEMASEGSSHNRSTSAEDHEEALLLGCPPIGRSGRRNMEQFGRKRKRGLISSA